MKIFSNRRAGWRVLRAVGSRVAARVNWYVIPAVIILCALELSAAAKDDGALILERANSNENIYSGGEFVSYLRGNVVFRYEGMRISSDEATWWKSKGIVDFRKNVKAEEKGQIVTCDRMHFSREKSLLTAVGNVLYADSAKITLISGTNAEYATDKKECVLRGNPLLTRIDSSGVDTLFIRGRVMKYDDSLKIATVTDNVNIRQGELVATCRKSDYFVNANTALLRINPVINYEKHRVTGDSIDLFFDEQKLKSASVMGNAHGRGTEVDSSKDTTITNVRSDSLYLTMYESGKMSGMKAYGHARGDFSETTAATKAKKVTHVTGDSLQMSMFETGKISGMKAHGHAHGNINEHTESTKVKTVTKITSDSLQMFMFETGKINGMKAHGHAVGSYSEVSELTGNATTMDITSDSMHMSMFETGKVNAMKAFGSAHGRSAEWGAASTDSTITHIWSDSLRVAVAEEGKVNSMKAFGSVLSRNFVQGDSARANEVSGQRMMITFGDGGKIEKAVIRGNAKSVYYIEDTDGGGCNEAGGEQIVVTFSQGKAQRLRVRGNSKGIYYP
jgi:lipopolysaccharide export system protein LptA